MGCCSTKKGGKKGFTLIEMLIVIVIIGVLASALIPRLGSARGKANDVAGKADLQQLATALISYQIDNNAFPNNTSKAQISNTGVMGAALIKGGMASIPVGNSTTYTGIDNVVTSGYMYYPMKKNGGIGNGFVLMAKSETDGGSNRVWCLSGGINPTVAVDGSYDVDTIKPCTSISTAGTCSQSACTYVDKAELRYIYKY